MPSPSHPIRHSAPAVSYTPDFTPYPMPLRVSVGSPNQPLPYAPHPQPPSRLPSRLPHLPHASAPPAVISSPQKSKEELRPCHDYMMGKCTRPQCKFYHPVAERPVQHPAWQPPSNVIILPQTALIPVVAPVPAPLPQKPKDKQDLRMCLDFVMDKCKRPQCKFPHPNLTELKRIATEWAEKGPICPVFVMTGTCKFGPKCCKVHPTMAAVAPAEHPQPNGPSAPLKVPSAQPKAPSLSIPTDLAASVAGRPVSTASPRPLPHFPGPVAPPPSLRPQRDPVASPDAESWLGLSGGIAPVPEPSWDAEFEDFGRALLETIGAVGPSLDTNPADEYAADANPRPSCYIPGPDRDRYVDHSFTDMQHNRSLLAY